MTKRNTRQQACKQARGNYPYHFRLPMADGSWKSLLAPLDVSAAATALRVLRLDASPLSLTEMS